MSESVLAGQVNGINHLALVCSDMARTVEFYEGLLGFKLIKTVELPAGMGQHFFFDMGNGSSLAFFWFPNAPEGVPGISHPGREVGSMSSISSMNHVAFDVPADKIEELRERLIAAGVECSPVVNHDDSKWGAAKEMHEGVFVRSVYFRDPDDFQLELAAWTKVFDESDVRHAPVSAVSAASSTA